MLPSFLLINARSLLPKIDDLTALLSANPVDLVAITESWLHKDIEDSLLHIKGFNLFRKDRTTRRGGGVCVFLRDEFPCTRRFDFENNDFECLWLFLRPKRLPRPLTGIAVSFVYHPPNLTAQEHKDLNEYLINTTDLIRNKHPDHGVVLLGDFKDFDIRNLTSNQNLKQVVEQPTRGSTILDLIVTNLDKIYSSPTIIAPLGSSDHSIIQWFPLSERPVNDVKPVKQFVRRYTRSGLDSFGRWITTRDWFSELGPNMSVDSLAESFSNQITEAIDLIFPQKSVNRHPTDKPWITPEIKLLIKDRQRAFHSNNLPLWRSLKQKVQKEITARKKKFYKNKVQHFKKNGCRMWWKLVNKMAGKFEKKSNFSFDRDGKTLEQPELVNVLNEFYVSVNSDIPPIAPTVEPYEVCIKLLAVSPFKAHGPDNVPSRILKEFAFELAEPISIIFNESLQSGTVPTIWKDSNITPIPKTQSPTCEDIQSNLDSITSWSSQNFMKLNSMKWKEMRVCFLRETPELSPLVINGQILELVHSHKVLGLIIQSNLKWNNHINSVVSKASKRLYILRVLRRSGILAEDLVTLYYALVRSLLEYCCVVWHHAVPSYLADELERVQKRALRIILPGQSYKEALSQLKCSRLDERREELCLKTMKKISKGGPLADHIPKPRSINHNYSFRNLDTLITFNGRTERYRRSFFPSTSATLKTI